MQLSGVPGGSRPPAGEDGRSAQPLWAPRALPPTSADAVVLECALTAPVDVTTARQELGARLVRAELPQGADREDIDRLLLAFEELGSNGLRHGQAPVRVRVTRTGEGWLVDVTDGALDRAPEPAVDRDPAFGGLGLYLVARLSAAHGWMIQRDRKHVWACVRPA